MKKRDPFCCLGDFLGMNNCPGKNWELLDKPLEISENFGNLTDFSLPTKNDCYLK